MNGLIDDDIPVYEETGTLYMWDGGTPPKRLYGHAILPSSTIPDGRVMTLRNTNGDELVIRGEAHEDRIRFIHLCGEGGDWTLGAWVPYENQDKARYVHGVPSLVRLFHVRVPYAIVLRPEEDGA